MLAIVGIAQLMIVLDTTIVNIALRVARDYARRLRRFPVDQVLGDFLSSLLNAAQVKLSGRDARLLIDVTAMAHEHARPNLCRPASAAFQSRLCPASSACIRRGVACPACPASCQQDRRFPRPASSAPM